jgi:asparaginyl-tRNA synthetase
MIEPEICFAELSDDMALAEDYVKYCTAYALEHCGDDLHYFEHEYPAGEKGLKARLENVANSDFARITYTEAVELLQGKREWEGQNAIALLEEDLATALADVETISAEIAEREAKVATPGMKKGEIAFNQGKIIALRAELEAAEERSRNIPVWLESARSFEYGNDLGGSDETVITRLFDVPVMVYNWPHEVKAFYMKRDPEDGRFARGVDVLAPEGYGEIVGGGERETDLAWLVGKIEEHGLPMDAFEWYLDLRLYGSVPHSGFGLGLERLVTWICKLPHVREAIPFPRMYGRLKP